MKKTKECMRKVKERYFEIKKIQLNIFLKRKIKKEY